MWDTRSNLFCHQTTQTRLHVSGVVAVREAIKHIGNTSAMRGNGMNRSMER